MMPFFDDDEFFGDLLLMGAAGGGKAVDDTATGNPVTFVTDLARPLKSLLIPFTPVQSGSGDPSPQNVRPIVPWEGLKVWHGGKNLAKLTYGTKVPSVNTGQMVTSNGWSTDFIRIDKIKNYYCSGYTVSNGNVYVLYYGADGAYLGWKSHNATDSPNGFLLNSDSYFSSAAYIKLRNDSSASTVLIIQLEEGSSATDYEAPAITETDISFPSPVYGGTHEAVSGKLIDNRYPVNITPQEVPSIYIDTVTSTLMTIYIQYAQNHIPSVVANSVISNRFSRNISSGNSGRMVQTNAGVYLVLPADEMTGTDLTAVREWFANNPTILVFELATPQEITLTPEQITALKGDNTIWSDADGSMTAVYLKKG